MARPPAGGVAVCGVAVIVPPFALKAAAMSDSSAGAMVLNIGYDADSNCANGYGAFLSGTL